MVHGRAEFERPLADGRTGPRANRYDHGTRLVDRSFPTDASYLRGINCGTVLFRFVRSLFRGRTEAHHTGVEVDLDARSVHLTVAVRTALIGQLLSREQFTDNAHSSTIVRFAKGMPGR